jgi:hypothetical protein
MLDKVTRRHGHAAAQPIAAFPFPGFPVNIWGAALTFNAECYATLHESFLAFSREWQDFLSGRMTEDFALLQRVGSARSPEEVWSTYVAFWQKAAEDYSAEFGRAAKLAGSLVGQSMATVQRQMEAATAEIAPFDKAA